MGIYVLVAEVEVICAKEEEGRISERKSSVEEKGSVLEQPQDGLDRCLEPIFDIATETIFVVGKEGVVYKAIKLM